MESLKKTGKKIGIIIIVLLILLALFFWFQNNHIVVSDHYYASEKVSAEFDGFTIVHISDLHNKTFGENQKKLIRKIAACEPDVILVTGDIVDRSRTDIDAAGVFLEEAAKLAPVYYVTGNHEKDLAQEDYAKLKDAAESAGTLWLDNETVEFSADAGTNHISISGIDNNSLSGPVTQELFKNNDGNNLTLLLAHQPQLFKYYAQQGVDMVFSGHAHGGQWRLPFVGGLVAPGQGFFPEYSEGVHVTGETTMYVSRGLGNSIFPLRLFNYPEVVCVRLQAIGV